MATKTKATNPDAHIAPLSLGGTTNDEKYLFCNLKNVKETFVGRAQSAEIAAELPNGVLCWLEAPKDGETHIFEAKNAIPAGGQLTATNLPWVLFRPEITPYEDTRMDYVMGHFRMKSGKAHPAWQLNLFDKVEYSQDYFQDAPVVNDYYDLVYLNEQFNAKNGGAQQGQVYWKVVSIHEVQTPIAYSNQNQFPGMPESKKMYTLQLVVKPN